MVRPNGIPTTPTCYPVTQSCPILLPNGLIRKKPKPANECRAKRCKTKMVVPIRCPTCNQDFCATHRYPKDHACSTTDPPAPSSSVKQPLQTRSGSTAAKTNAGLAAIRRVREKANAAMKHSSTSPSGPKIIIELSDSSDDDTFGTSNDPLLPTTSARSKSKKPSQSAQAADGDSDIEFISSTAPASKKTSVLKKPLILSAEERKTAKRVKAERQSALKALHVRAQKGRVFLLSPIPGCSYG